MASPDGKVCYVNATRLDCLFYRNIKTVVAIGVSGVDFRMLSTSDKFTAGSKGSDSGTTVARGQTRYHMQDAHFIVAGGQ